MTWERALRVLSLAGNVILVTVLFFKTALNEILTHWYKERVKRKDKSREILLDLNPHMTALGRDDFMMLVD